MLEQQQREQGNPINELQEKIIELQEILSKQGIEKDMKINFHKDENDFDISIVNEPIELDQNLVMYIRVGNRTRGRNTTEDKKHCPTCHQRIL